MGVVLPFKRDPLAELEEMTVAFDEAFDELNDIQDKYLMLSKQVDDLQYIYDTKIKRYSKTVGVENIPQELLDHATPAKWLNREESDEVNSL